jgi:Alkaline phosphatase
MDKYVFVINLEEYKNTYSKNIGFFTAYDDPSEKYLGREPSLNDIIDITLLKLKSYNKPFFLLVESSQIDWAEHDNDPEYLLSEMLEFDSAIKSSYDYADNNKNTLVVVTGDHETGGASIIDGDVEESIVKTEYSSENHTAEMVPVYSYGYNSSNFTGVYDNTEIFDKLKSIIEK